MHQFQVSYRTGMKSRIKVFAYDSRKVAWEHAFDEAVEACNHTESPVSIICSLSRTQWIMRDGLIQSSHQIGDPNP